MKLYTHDGFKGMVILDRSISGQTKYKVTRFYKNGVSVEIMPKKYISLGRLLMAAEKLKLFVDTESAGI